MPTSVEMAEALLRRLLDVKRLIDSLHEDVFATVSDVASGKPSASRAYVRSVFGLVEGALSGMCAFLVEGQDVWGWTLTEQELKTLWDAVPSPSVPRPQGGRATLTERAKQAFKTGRRLFGSHCSADFGGAAYASFRDAIRARDRLMHPKLATDLEVSQSDLAMVDLARDWFRANAKTFFEAAVVTLQKKVAATDRRTIG